MTLIEIVFYVINEVIGRNLLGVNFLFCVVGRGGGFRLNLKLRPWELRIE